MDCVIDVTRSPSMEKHAAVEFFTAVAASLGAAAHAADVRAPSCSRSWGPSAASHGLSRHVASAEVARLLLELATADDATGDVDVAGPRRENLVDLVRRLVDLRGDG